MTKSYNRSLLEVPMVPSVYSTARPILPEVPSFVWCVKLSDKLWMITRSTAPLLHPTLFPCSKMINQEAQNGKERNYDKTPRFPIVQVKNYDGSSLSQCILMIVLRNACQGTWQRWSRGCQRATIRHCKLL